MDNFNTDYQLEKQNHPENYNDEVICDNCKCILDPSYAFCPYCGYEIITITD